MHGIEPDNSCQPVAASIFLCIAEREKNAANLLHFGDYSNMGS